MVKTDIKRIYKNAKDFENLNIKVAGWVRTIRLSKTFGFIELNDGSFLKSLQIVFEDDVVDNFDEISKLNVGSSIVCEGILVLTPNSKQPFELKAKKIFVEGKSTPDYPLQKKRHSFEFLRTLTHLRPRTNTFSAVFRIRSFASYAIHKFFNEKDFIYVNTPIITVSDCEGAGEMFRVSALDFDNLPKEDGKVDFSQDFFGKEAFLTVSGQLEAESYAQSFGKVYTFGPTFRAENSNTSRHAAEFWMVEPEMAFADLFDNMKLAEEMMKYIIDYCLKNAPEEMEFFNRFIDNTLLERLENVVSSEFEHITYTEAINILEKSKEKFEYEVKWGIDLQTEHERYITEKVFKKPTFVTDYPKEIKAFYMRLNDDDKTVAAMDLLVPGVGEIIGGSQREEREDVLIRKMKEANLSPDDYWWYIDLRKYGTTKHAGFGLGFERMIMYLTGMSNIRDVTSFPRNVNNADI